MIFNDILWSDPTTCTTWPFDELAEIVRGFDPADSESLPAQIAALFAQAAGVAGSHAAISDAHHEAAVANDMFPA